MKTISLLITPCILAGLLFTFAGCAHISSAEKNGSSGAGHAESLVIPDYPTARDQFGFANVYENSELVSPELGKRREQMAKVSQMYQKVITNFPNDKEYVPRSYLQLGDCAGMSENYNQAIDYYHRAQATAPGNDFVQARAMYSIGRVYDHQRLFERGKEMYKQVVDRYANSSGASRAVARKAAVLYYQVKDKNPLKPVEKDPDSGDFGIF